MAKSMCPVKIGTCGSNCRDAFPHDLGRIAADSIEDKAQICAGCHGENGIPQEKTTPIIWGQNEGYLYIELRDFKSGARKNDHDVGE